MGVEGIEPPNDGSSIFGENVLPFSGAVQFTTSLNTLLFKTKKPF